MLCNILTVILRPNFEEPLDTAKQLVEKNITIFFDPMLGENNRQWLRDHPIPEYRILGENGIVADDWVHYDNIIANDVLGEGTHAIITHWIDWYVQALGKKYHPDGRAWYNSKERLSASPYAGYITNKKWPLNEVLYKIKYSYS